MKAQTKEMQEKMTASKSLQSLKDGNVRFQNNLRANRNLIEQTKDTSTGQYPFAVILSCIDSRVPAELVFDQGIGDIFSVRVAGNIINEDVLGSMEYSCKVAGSKIAIVMGHTKCGAVTAACSNVELGNITPLLQKIKPAVDLIREENSEMTDENIENVSIQNVILSIDRIRKESPILKEMEDNREIEIVGALYNVSTGKVRFFD